jgi:hypothetical protein
MKSVTRSRTLDRFADEEAAVRDPELRAHAAQARLDTYSLQFARAGWDLRIRDVIALLDSIGEGQSVDFFDPVLH